MISNISLDDPKYEKQIAVSTDHNYAHIHHEILKMLAESRVSGSAYRVACCLLYSISQEYIKNRKHYCRITYSEMCEFTGMGRQSVRSGLEKLVENEIIIQDRKTKKDIIYGFNVLYNKKDEDIDMKPNPLGRKSYGGWKDKDSLYTIKKLDSWDRYNFCMYMRDSMKRIAKAKNAGHINFLFSKVRVDHGFHNITCLLNEASGQKFCNLIMKAYIDWFIQNKALDLWDKSKNAFTLEHFSKAKRVDEFFEAHQIGKDSSAKRINEVLKDYNISLEEKEIEEENDDNIENEMSDIYGIGMKSFLSEYGIVLSINYMINKEGVSLKNALKQVGDVIKECKKSKKMSQKIIERTFYHAPYPDEFAATDWMDIFSDYLPYLGGRTMAEPESDQYYPFEFLVKGA
jgi:hypothetical protein